MANIQQPAQESTRKAYAEFDVEAEQEDEKLLIDGVLGFSAGASRHKYLAVLRRRKVIVGVSITLGVLAAIAVIAGLAYGLKARKLHYKCPSGLSRKDVDLAFFVVGDWGRQGNANQLRAARMMSDVGACIQPDFVISTGDNFYQSGLKSENDPLMQKSFSNVYTHPSLQVPWYSVLGNHDYGDTLTAFDVTGWSAGSTLEQCVSSSRCYSPMWQTGPNATLRDARWHCQQGSYTRTIPLGTTGRTLDLIMIDTNPLIPRYRTKPWASIMGGVGSIDAEEQRAVILDLVKASNATWRIVVGHHPIHSYGEHCTGDPATSDCGVMSSFLQSVLAPSKIAAYMNGHDHDLQLIKTADDPVYYVVSGAGSDVRAGEFSSLPDSVAKDSHSFFADDQGFVLATLAGDTLNLYYYTSRQSAVAFHMSLPRPV